MVRFGVFRFGVLLALLMSLILQTSLTAAAPPAQVELGRAAPAQPGPTTFWVVLKEQADLRPAFTIPNWDARGRFVFNRLVAVANTAQPEVAEVLPERTYHIPDPLPGMDEISVSAVEWNIDRINAPQVWSGFGVRGEGIVVANIDTGVQFDHPALVRQYRGNQGAAPSTTTTTGSTPPVCAAARPWSPATITVTAATRWAPWSVRMRVESTRSAWLRARAGSPPRAAKPTSARRRPCWLQGNGCWRRPT